MQNTNRLPQVSNHHQTKETLILDRRMVADVLKTKLHTIRIISVRHPVIETTLKKGEELMPVILLTKDLSQEKKGTENGIIIVKVALLLLHHHLSLPYHLNHQFAFISVSTSRNL